MSCVIGRLYRLEGVRGIVKQENCDFSYVLYTSSSLSSKLDVIWAERYIQLLLISRFNEMKSSTRHIQPYLMLWDNWNGIGES